MSTNFWEDIVNELFQGFAAGLKYSLWAEAVAYLQRVFEGAALRQIAILVHLDESESARMAWRGDPDMLYLWLQRQETAAGFRRFEVEPATQYLARDVLAEAIAQLRRERLPPDSPPGRPCTGGGHKGKSMTLRLAKKIWKDGRKWGRRPDPFGEYQRSAEWRRALNRLGRYWANKPKTDAP